MTDWNVTEADYKKAKSAWHRGVDCAIYHAEHLVDQDQWLISEILVHELFVQLLKKMGNAPELPELTSGPGGAIFAILRTSHYLNVPPVEALHLIKADRIVRPRMKHQDAWSAMFQCCAENVRFHRIETLEKQHRVLSTEIIPPLFLIREPKPLLVLRPSTSQQLEDQQLTQAPDVTTGKSESSKDKQGEDNVTQVAQPFKKRKRTQTVAEEYIGPKTRSKK
ncbi:hypothetical protein M422DRAFT_253595 [Sphaerobolus stellatus SS14]|uniref:Uncharacterized protein n=1 Tax=Sphaerobolus stellatus (strain SS14) TaxID=990650 RepID=A0A0C9UJ46_SPHS4|nr:hypothetical protein M422DRAFT_253595 [Sphaerobolus stellatus SS14]